MSKTKLIPFSVEESKQGAKIVTRSGYPVRVGFYDVKDKVHPISAAVDTGDLEIVLSYTLDGKFNEYGDSSLDLFIEEDEVETCKENNVLLHSDGIGINPDGWYICQSTICSDLGINGRFWFIGGKTYSGNDILKWSIGFSFLGSYEDYFQPWSIFNAKSGDILASTDGQDILIFGYMDKDNSRIFYSQYNIRGKSGGWNVKYFKPATEEQRTQIYKKMKDEGYM